jgi:plasmid stability protein
MAVLHLENVPDDLVRQLKDLAAREQLAPEAKAVSLLQAAVQQEDVRARQRVAEVLERFRENAIRPDPDGPSVVEMLREDRDR